VQPCPTPTCLGNLAGSVLSGRPEIARADYLRVSHLAGLQRLAGQSGNASAKGRLALCTQEGDVKQAAEVIVKKHGRSIPTDVTCLLPGASVRPFGGQIEGYPALREAFKKGQPPAMAQRNPTCKVCQQDPTFQSLVKEFTKPD